MYRSIVVGITCLVLSVSVAFSQDKKEDAKKEVTKDGIEWKLDYLEKTWGIKFKSATVGDKKDGRIRILLTFSKDVENVNELRTAFKAPMTNKAQSTAPIKFYLFDKDDIVLNKAVISGTDELTGKQGDSFRVYLSGLENQIERIKKVEPRKNTDKAK